MDISHFFAKWLGVYMLVCAILMIINKQQFERVLREFFNSKTVVAYSGFVKLFIGLAILIANPIWELTWRGLITVVAILAILGGLVRINFPEHVQKYAAQVMSGGGYWGVAGILGVLGIILTYSGFML